MSLKQCKTKHADKLCRKKENSEIMQERLKRQRYKKERKKASDSMLQ